MTAPKPAENPRESLKADLDNLALSVANSAQIILFMDSTGAIRAEMPGINGVVRRKIDLPLGIRENPDLITLLQTELYRIRDLRAAQTKTPAPKPDYEAARHEKNAQIARERAERHRLWFDNLTEDQKALETAKMVARVEKLNAQIDSRAREIWTYCAETHSIQLANRIIDDPTRRPRKRVMINGQEVSPRNTSAMTAALAGTKPHKRNTKKINPALAVDL